VKYHLGTSYNRPTVNGKMVHLSLMANPSHLEVRGFGRGGEGGLLKPMIDGGRAANE
jgi:hypothetical protein